MGRLKKKIAETDDFLWVLVSRDGGLDYLSLSRDELCIHSTIRVKKWILFCIVLVYSYLCSRIRMK